MTKVQVRFTDYFAQTIQRMREDGLLLASVGADGKPNVMTTGWGTMGCIWSRPVFIVLVRPRATPTADSSKSVISPSMCLLENYQQP